MPMEPTAAPPLTFDRLLATPLGQMLRGPALVAHCESGEDKNRHTYLKLTLRLSGGHSVEARWWQFTLGPDRAPVAGAVWDWAATVAEYRGERQLTINQGQALPEADPADYDHAARRPLPELIAHFRALVATLDDAMAALVLATLSGVTFERYCVWPAALRRHAAVRHGLIAHSVLVAETARNLARTYGPDGLPADMSLVVAACLLHDVGKIDTLPLMAGGAIPEAAKTLDHVTRGVLRIQAAWLQAEPRPSPERLAALLHAVMAHHRLKDWGSPVEPQTVEAALLHAADYAEAFLWGYSDQEA